MTQAQFERLGVQFVDCVPLNARLQGGIQPSTFAYVEGSNGSAQLKVPAPVEGEVIAVNAMVVSQPGSAVMPPGFLVQVDAGEADEEASREFEEKGEGRSVRGSSGAGLGEFSWEDEKAKYDMVLDRGSIEGEDEDEGWDCRALQQILEDVAFTPAPPSSSVSSISSSSSA
ncbi:hypothetical protein B484DRAFT_400482 [Ochromonadaceae sp. CCMP2298]|nr:hypothetical protein B484DRAFT_400482 [Ochromonadaceae sp. CCMP2298]